MKSSCVLKKFVLLFAVISCWAQQPSSEQGPSVPTFQSATRLVVLDVVVTDRQGKPVRNLSKEDFTILEDGQRQTVASFEAPDQHAPVEIDLPRGQGNGGSEPTPEKIGAQPVTVLVFDALDTKILDQAYARYEIKKFLHANGPQLSQPTALMALEENRLELLHDYTRDAKELAHVLDSHRAQLPFRLLRSMGGGDTYVGRDPNDAAERFVDAVQGLREIATANMQFAGRKNLIWIGPGFPSLGHFFSTSTGQTIADDTTGWSGIGFRDFKDAQSGSPPKLTLRSWEHETLELLWRARISVYTIDPRGLEVLPDEGIDPPTGDLAFEQVAPLTGGRIIREANDIDARIAKSVDESSAYYSITYYPLNRDWNGKFRRVRVVMKDPQLKAMSREGYYAVLDTKPTTQDLDRLLSLAVLNPLAYHALELQAAARVLGKLQRVAHINVHMNANQLHWESPRPDQKRCEITLLTAGFSSDSQVVAHNLKEFQVAVDENKYEKLLKDGMVMGLAVQLPANVVRMRVVVRDSTNGNLGTADLTSKGEQFH